MRFHRKKIVYRVCTHRRGKPCISVVHGAFCFALLLITGCAGPKPVPVEGTVTLGGEPVTSGMVYLMPDGTQGNSGQPALAPIVEGKFSVPQKFGVFTGPYIIMVRESDIEEADAPDISVVDDTPVVVAAKKATPQVPDNRMRFPEFTMWHDFPKGASQYSLTIEMPKPKRR